MNENEYITQWREINGYDGTYSVNQFGYVRNNLKNKMLSPGITSGGYKSVSLCKNGEQKTFLVHRLVAEYFIKKDDVLHNVVNHIDGNKLNNYYKNLEWCTHKMNLCHARNTLHRVMGKGKKRVKCVNTGEIFESAYMAHIVKKINYGNICSVLSGKRLTAGGLFWEYVDSKNVCRGSKKCREPIMCVETGVIYDNVSQAFRKTKIYNINSAALGRRKTAGGYHWKKIDKKYFTGINKNI